MAITQVTSLGRNGLGDWLIQRVSSIVLTIYFLVILGFIATHPALQFTQWQSFFSHILMRLFTILTLLCLIGHTWIGIWTVLTDYVKCSSVRLTMQTVIAIGMLFCLGWGIQIVWGII